MAKFEWGFYLDKIPYVKGGNGPKKIVIFPFSGELTNSLAVNPPAMGKLVKRFIPSDYTFWVLGYDRNLPADHTSESMAADFAEIIREHIGPAVIMGISYGGFIAIPFAALYPELTQKLILLVTAHTLSENGIELGRKAIELAQKGDYYGMFRLFDSLYRNRILRAIVRFSTFINRKKMIKTMNPISTFINAYMHINDTIDRRKMYLPKIKAPTLIIGAEEDQFFGGDIYREAAELIPDAEAVIFPDAGHMVPVEKMFAVKKVIKRFLSD